MLTKKKTLTTRLQRYVILNEHIYSCIFASYYRIEITSIYLLWRQIKQSPHSVRNALCYKYLLLGFAISPDRQGVVCLGFLSRFWIYHATTVTGTKQLKRSTGFHDLRISTISESFESPKRTRKKLTL